MVTKDTCSRYRGSCRWAREKSIGLGIVHQGDEEGAWHRDMTSQMGPCNPKPNLAQGHDWANGSQ